MLLEIQFKTHITTEKSQGGRQTEVNDLGGQRVPRVVIVDLSLIL